MLIQSSATPSSLMVASVGFDNYWNIELSLQNVAQLLDEASPTGKMRVWT
jgi:hypothetical protein